MITVGNILEKLNLLAPEMLALEYDNVGLLVGNKSQEVSGILISLDATVNSVAEATKQGCNLIVTHHPVIFNPLKNVVSEGVAFKAVESGISIISMHTNLDIAEKGVNFWLAQALGLKGLERVELDEISTYIGNLENEMTPYEFAKYLKQRLGGVVRYTDCGKPIKSVLLVGGSGGEYLNGAADAFLTGEMRYHEFIDAENGEIQAFEAGHYDTEAVVLEPLAEFIKSAYDIKCVVFKDEVIKTL